MWLLEPNMRAIIAQVEKNGFNPTAKQIEAFSSLESDSPDSRIMSIAGDTADIHIRGVLTDTPSFMALIFGGGNTTYPDIISAIASAEQNDDISNIILSVDSPGGHIDGLFSAISAIALAEKPVKAIVSNQATSAAFALAAQADEVVALNEASRFGSVGVKASFFVSENEVDITSTKAPKKAPDVTTEEGKADIRAELDPIHDIFVSSIAKGRDTTTEKVNADFGQGGTVLAEEAIKRGMIDSISNSIPQVSDAAGASALSVVTPTAIAKIINNTSANKGANQREVKSMDIAQLKSEHPATFAAAVKLGADGERDRVSAHLTMGEASGDMATATKAISEGSEMTANLQATYMAAGMKKNELAARAGDNPGDLDTGGDENDGPSAEDAVADAVCAAMGYEEGGTIQ